MRTVIISALAAVAALAMTSIASAQADPQVPDKSNAAANHTAKATEVGGPTAAQEDAIPYRPCSVALGWANGRLQCRDY